MSVRCSASVLALAGSFSGCITGAYSHATVIPEDLAVKIASKAAAKRCPFVPVDEFDDKFKVSEIRVRDGAYYLLFDLKRPAMGGIAEVWVAGQTGKVAQVYCYQ